MLLSSAMLTSLLPMDPAVRRRVDLLELPFNRHGIDPYGIEKNELARFLTLLGFFYQKYFSVEVYGDHHVPEHGRAMLVGNHSGGVAIDAMMVIAANFFDASQPRLVQSMADKFLAKVPFSAEFTARIGQFTGLPEHAKRLLEDDRLLAVFPEGHRGTAKLASEADTLVKFGTGFMRQALTTKSPIVPFAFIGGGDAYPTFMNLYRPAKLIGMPYIPVTKYLLPVPKPTRLQILYSEPMHFDGNGREDDATIATYVAEVRERIAGLIKEGRALREGQIHAGDLEFR